MRGPGEILLAALLLLPALLGPAPAHGQAGAPAPAPGHDHDHAGPGLSQQQHDQHGHSHDAQAQPGDPGASGAVGEGHSHGPAGHEGAEGLALGPGSDREFVSSGPACGPDLPRREYALAAVEVEITLNRYLDYDPLGRMYVLEEDLARVREEEARNRDGAGGAAPSRP